MISITLIICRMVSSISILFEKPVQIRKSYSVKFKRHAINAINDLMLHGYTLCAATKELNIPHLYYKRWRKTIVKVDKLASSDAVVPFKINGESRKIHPGRPSALDPFEGDLMRSIFEMREQGLPVNTRTLRKEAARLSQVFKDKSIKAKISSVNRFVKKTGLSHRVSTHVAQKDHKETEEESAHFMNLMRQKVLGMDPDDIINMDQTPVPYSFPSNRTLDKKGSKTINVRTSTSDTKRATLAATVTASGKLLTPFLIFKGKTDGRIASKELQTYPNECIYACQEKAWMDEAMMNVWIDLVLIPWKNAWDPDVVPLLVLDA